MLLRLLGIRMDLFKLWRAMCLYRILIDMRGINKYSRKLESHPHRQ